MTRPDIRFIETGPEAPAVVISLQGQHFGPEAAGMVDWFDTILWALDRLRSGDWDTSSPETVSEIDTAITHLVHRLEPRLEGLTAALIRAHYAAGGSHGQLATAMDVSRSTAQSRAVRLPEEPSIWETWARGESTT
ncbi:hypothetical protein IMZ11_42140 [Microtetraspora sp. AC03309]|uniref:hypothetical protein n=1 Tax=Microtetraspora sp. AC03309 TaxID=2779376 RepID=UPI001E579F6A|nr:hypothetical protein [Microtetraspora sp. AC03309]MCC5582209.1 hypothetical protein [Microtetraspora sp. AC03309]